MSAGASPVASCGHLADKFYAVSGAQPARGFQPLSEIPDQLTQQPGQCFLRFRFRRAFQQKPEQREAVFAQGIWFGNKVLWCGGKGIHGQAFGKMRWDGVV